MPQNNASTQSTCYACSKIVRKNSNSIQCATCRFWYHAKCTGLSNDEFKITANKVLKNKILWKCGPCISEVSVRTTDDLSEADTDVDDDDDNDKLLGKYEKMLVNQFNRFSREFESKFERFKNSVENNLSDIRKEVNKISKQNTLLTNKCNLLEDRVTSVEDELKSFTPMATEDIIAEINERKRREVNVIALNVPESKKADGKERLEEDRAQLATILPPEMVNQTKDIKLRRLGRQSAGRTRPLLIETKSTSDARTIFKYKPDQDTRVVFKPDLTPAQQKHLSSLRTKLETLNVNGKSNKTIKYVNGIPKIVDINFRQVTTTKNKPAPHAGVLPERARAEDETGRIPHLVSK